MGKLTGLLHDSGKGSVAFQNYLLQNSGAKRGDIPHVFCGARYTCDRWGLDGSAAGIAAQLVATAICSHHSRLPDVTGVTGTDGLRQRMYPQKEVDYEGALRNYFAESASEEELNVLFQKAVGEVEHLVTSTREIVGQVPLQGRRNSTLFFLGMAQRYLLSCLLDADRYDTYLFSAKELPPDLLELRSIWGELADRLESRLGKFPCISSIDRKRKEISDQCLAFSAHGAGVYRLSVPTGSGKTMSSLRFALNCCLRNGKKHIYYVAPYKSILEQNANEIRDALSDKKIQGKDPWVDSLILEHHSDVVVETGEQENERLKRYQMLTQRWDSPMILTTSVQFLNTLFDGRSVCVRRMHSLADSVIILDEAQAMPIKCTYLLNDALNFLAGICNCTVVLCTATQPESQALDIPVIPGKPPQMTENLEDVFTAFHRTRVIDLSAKGGMNAETLADFALARLESCDNALFVLNTKSAAKRLYHALAARMQVLPKEERIPLCCLTTSLCPAHRTELICNIKKILSEETTAGRRMICVSTQLIEAGVNVSFQCVVRSLAGLDSIAQAAGRCNRHGETACRDVFIIKCTEEVLTSLPDIDVAQKATEEVLESYRDNPDQLDGDLLSPKAIQRYYNTYFKKQKGRLAYPVGPKDTAELFDATTLLDLLSVNTLSGKACAEHHTTRPQHPLHQAFETAGNLFEAIEKGGMDVIVPYGEGKQRIAELYARPDLRKLPAILRESQRYSVHLFEGEQKQLSEMGAIDILPDTGAAVLREGFYDDVFGVQLHRGEMDLLMN